MSSLKTEFMRGESGHNTFQAIFTYYPQARTVSNRFQRFPEAVLKILSERKTQAPKEAVFCEICEKSAFGLNFCTPFLARRYF
ncbi:MAG: hypothetical protein B6245_17480 [Desulfobacteraceae bacterium 4572_88]|nr:MAG: hypothetical protein B6245_17480 [Desulfobacteraceae bacterium 4572_88]